MPGKAKDYTCELVLKGHRPFMYRSYMVPYTKCAAVQREIEKIIAGHIIEESVSAHSNPLGVVMKKDGQVRLRLDTRGINQIIVTDREAPEKIDKILQRFAG